MLSRALVAIALLTSPAAAESLPVFTGDWIGEGYSCFNKNGESVTLTEEVEVVASAEGLVAYKTTGDRCVNAGEITWKSAVQPGDLAIGESYPVKSHAGTPSGTRVWYDGEIKLIDANTIQWTFITTGSAAQKPVTFRRKGVE